MIVDYYLSMFNHSLPVHKANPTPPQKIIIGDRNKKCPQCGHKNKKCTCGLYRNKLKRDN